MFIVFVIFKLVKEHNGGTVVSDPYATLEGGGNTPKSLIKKKKKQKKKKRVKFCTQGHSNDSFHYWKLKVQGLKEASRKCRSRLRS